MSHKKDARLIWVNRRFRIDPVIGPPSAVLALGQRPLTGHPVIGPWSAVLTLGQRPLTCHPVIGPRSTVLALD